ncbi:MAG: nitroreductase/quinone reductase family protein [Actinomycetota bacterium]|nr:nitroreductase/quinone reductase family protein [Actinomycetota bacterium]
MADPSIAGWVRAQVANPVLRTLLRSPAHRVLSGSLLLLDYSSRRSGQRCVFPVQYALRGDDVIVIAGQHRTKTWWRHFDTRPQHVTVHLRGRAASMAAQRLTPGTDDEERATRAYLERFPKAGMWPDSPVIVLRTEPAS